MPASAAGEGGRASPTGSRESPVGSPEPVPGPALSWTAADPPGCTNVPRLGLPDGANGFRRSSGPGVADWRARTGAHIHRPRSLRLDSTLSRSYFQRERGCRVYWFDSPVPPFPNIATYRSPNNISCHWELWRLYSRSPAFCARLVLLSSGSSTVAAVRVAVSSIF